MISNPPSTLPPIQKQNIRAFGLRQRAEKFKLPLLLMLAHIPLGVFLYKASSLALLHPLAVFFIGFRRAMNPEEKLERVAPIIIYLIGSEVLWRMAQIPIFWESGKYVSAAIMIIALVRRRCWKIPPLALLYFVFLIPSCIMTISNRPLHSVRDMLSFNMSGPFLLFISCWFCSYLKVDWEKIKTYFFTLITPLMSVAVTTLFYTVTAPVITFNTESNHATSGGFGPNQVSAMLGLGAFLCISAFLIFKNNLQENTVLGLLTVLFAAQSVMTFSRGGMYNALGAAFAVFLLRMLNPGEGLKRLLPIVALTIFFLAVIFPFLNDFTGGKLELRFMESDPTNRAGLVMADLEIFAEHPFFGVGVGESFFYYERMLNQIVGNHTEFSRMISEHGMFGIAAMVCLILIFVSNLIRQTSGAGKALLTGLFVWSSLFMFNAGMRLAAPSFILALCYLKIGNFPIKRKRIDFVKRKLRTGKR